MNLCIGLSYAPKEGGEKFQFYTDAIMRAAASLGLEVECVNLHLHPKRVEEIDAILFTGGADIDPARYGKPEETALCVGDIDEERDTHELELAEYAEEHELPTLGICRGAQLLNVAHGGTLLTDIQHYGGSDHTKIDNTDRRHHVQLEHGSFLRKILQVTDGETNSSHHQAIERAGDGLVVSARADDGIAEAIEYAEPGKHPFFLAVQWHPERLGFDESFGSPIFESFLLEVLGWKMLRPRMNQQKVQPAE